MGHFGNMIILVAIAVAATIVTSSEAAEYTVGDSTGWTAAAPGGASFYSDWASKIKFKEGDILVFKFGGSHTVAELNDKASFDNCDVNQNKEVISTSPARVTLNRTGDFYFACTVTGHCSAGQKLSVSVSAASSKAPASAPTPTPTPAQGSSPPPSGTNPTPPSSSGTPPPQSSPSEPGSTSPPPSPGSATSLVAAFSLVLVSLVVNSLF